MCAKLTRFTSELPKLVISVRWGFDDISVVDEFLDKLDVISVSEYNTAIVDFENTLKKVNVIKSWRSKGIQYLGKHDNMLLNKPHVYVLYITSHVSDKENLDKNEMLFLRKQATHAIDNGYVFIVVDQVLSNQLWLTEIRKATIRVYVNGKLECSDLYAEEGQDCEKCILKISSPAPCQTYPKNRTFVKLRCPNVVAGNSACTNDHVHWNCSECKEIVEYGTDDRLLYCKCGKSNPEQSMFRCNDKNHDMRFVKYPRDILRLELSQHRAMKEINILILGEIGVGKSTWINGFHLYQYFGDLKEAMNSTGFRVLIPSTFPFTERGKEKKIQVGKPDTNEVMECGKSTTKEPQSYVFHVDGIRIRMIDTPGIGDSKGVEEDRKNIDNILSHLSHYDEIHAVCILLKPNNSRLIAIFEFFIQELLAMLHSSVKDNIIFCFTNARGTFYQPGDTLPLLNTQLQYRNIGIQATPDNYFCFDNEPFRFLACVKNELKFSQTYIGTYIMSWEQSVNEIKRLLQYIDTKLKPHKVRETMSMNEARRIILAMSKPLAEVAKNINYNVQEAERVKQQKASFKQEIETKIKELKEEERLLMRASAKFGSFLNANAIIPYNDAVIDYLDMRIEHEKMKPKDIKNNTLLSRMVDTTRAYERQRQILDMAIRTGAGENIHTPDQVAQLQRELLQLKDYGPTVKSLFDGISITDSARNRKFT